MGKSPNARPNRYSGVGATKAPADVASWEDAEPETLWRTVQEVTNLGDAVMFGKTRDGGAVVVIIMSNDDRLKYYATGAEEIATLLHEIRASVSRAE